MRGKVPREARPTQTLIQNSGATGPKFTNVFQTMGVIGSVNESIHFAIIPSVVEYQRTEWRWGYANFFRFAPKSVKSGPH